MTGVGSRCERGGGSLGRKPVRLFPAQWVGLGPLRPRPLRGAGVIYKEVLKKISFKLLLQFEMRLLNEFSYQLGITVLF